MATDPAASAAVDLARASAALGTASARLGYELTTKALDESSAAAVFPPVLLEVTAIAESFAAYALVDLAWEAAQVAAAVELDAASARWSPPA